MQKNYHQRDTIFKTKLSRKSWKQISQPIIRFRFLLMATANYITIERKLFSRYLFSESTGQTDFDHSFLPRDRGSSPFINPTLRFCPRLCG